MKTTKALKLIYGILRHLDKCHYVQYHEALKLEIESAVFNQNLFRRTISTGRLDFYYLHNEALVFSYQFDPDNISASQPLMLYKGAEIFLVDSGYTPYRFIDFIQAKDELTLLEMLTDTLPSAEDHARGNCASSQYDEFALAQYVLTCYEKYRLEAFVSEAQRSTKKQKI